MSISKTALKSQQCHETLLYFNSAREAFQSVLHKLNEEPITLLLPAYIGWSSNEGSGIYDPVLSEQIPHEFYLLDNNLTIDMIDFNEKLKRIPGKKCVLFVHYFGYVDPSYEDAAKTARSMGCFIIEDAAHALFTDYVDGTCGNYCDVIFYSLHKMLPLRNGGMLRVRNSSFELPQNDIVFPEVFQYNFREISGIRKRNALLLEQRLEQFNEYFTIPRPSTVYANQTPQTFPIIFKQIDKSDLYFALNNLGFGVVSLYHTMITPLRNDIYKLACSISNTILNLPVHQDITETDILEFCTVLEELIYGKSKNI